MDFESVLNSIEGLSTSAKVDLQEAFYRVSKERDDAMTKVQEATARADALTIDRALAESAFIRDKVSPDPIRQSFAKEHWRDRFRVEGGRVVAYTPEGQKMFNGQGQPCTVDEALSRLISLSPHKATLLDRTDATSGTGTQRAPAGVKRMPRSQFDALSPREQMATVKAGFTFYDD